MDELDTLPELCNLKLLPHKRIRRCPKCGVPSRRLPSWAMRVLGLDSTAFNIVHCQGGAEPEATLQTPFGKQRVMIMCAGVQHEHLHIICRMCNYGFLMEVWAS